MFPKFKTKRIIKLNPNKLEKDILSVPHAQESEIENNIVEKKIKKENTFFRLFKLTIWIFIIA
ncbi:hypothetical protein ACFLY2_00415 [Patescibacteria group bacterium]